ncbi:MAG TPA: histidine kinase dimerization/phosphoacceptor domain -containing protein [Beijerinckiaceae bacterium]
MPQLTATAADDLDASFATRWMGWRQAPHLGYGLAVVTFFAAFLLRFALDEALPPGLPFVTFFPAVLLTAFVAGLGPGLLVALASGVAAWFFFLPPARSFGLDAGALLALGLYGFVIAANLAVIHAMQTAADRLQAERRRNANLAAHRELLFTELQHRVSNNLQVVSGLMTLQKATVADPQARAALAEASARLILIAKLHRKLHDPAAGLDFKAFLEDLCQDVRETAGVDCIACRVSAPEGLPLPSDKAVPIALIVVELLSNALEHGLAGRSEGTLSLDLRPHGLEPELMLLTVRDDGAGLPDGFDVERTNSLGLRIVRSLAQQIGARLEMLSDHGAICRLTFKL